MCTIALSEVRGNSSPTIREVHIPDIRRPGASETASPSVACVVEAMLVPSLEGTECFDLATLLTRSVVCPAVDARGGDGHQLTGIPTVSAATTRPKQERR